MIRALSRSFWQAYREQRVVLLVCMITVLFPALISQFVTVSKSQSLFVALSCPMLFILASCGMLLASERENGTLDSLRLMNPSRTGFLAGKFLWLLLGTLLFVLVSVWWTLFFIPPKGPSDIVKWPVLLIIVGAGWLESMGWGLFMTARCRTVFRALTYSTMFVFISGVLFSSFLVSAEQFNTQPEDLLGIPMIARYSIGVIVLLIGSRSILRELSVPASLQVGRRKRWRQRDLFSGLVNRRHLSAVLWQESRIQLWSWLPMLFPFAIGSLLLLIDNAADSPIGWLVFVVPLVISSAMLGAFSTRYDLDGRSYEFFEQAGIPMRHVWKNRFLLSLPQWLLLVVIWLAMCGAGRIPVINNKIEPWSYGWNFEAVSHGELIVTVMVASLLSLFVCQFIAANIHRAVLAWAVIFVAGMTSIAVCFLWFCQLGKTSLWISAGVLALLVIGGTMAKANKLFSMRLSGFDRATALGCTALLPIGMFSVQYLHWLATGPEPPKDDRIPTVMTNKELVQLRDKGRIARPELPAKEQSFLDILEFDWSGLKETPTLPVGEMYESFSQEDKGRLLQLVLNTQDEGLSSTKKELFKVELERAEQLAQWARISATNSGLVLLINQLYQDDSFPFDDARRLEFCRGFIEFTRFTEKYHIAAGTRNPSSNAYQLLWEWCDQEGRSAEELEQVLEYLTKHAYDWDETDCLVAAFCAFRLRYSLARESGFYWSDYDARWVERLPGYHQRYDNWLRYTFVNAIKDRTTRYPAATRSLRQAMAGFSSQRVTDDEFDRTKDLFRLAQYASGLFEFGAPSMDLIESDHDVRFYAEAVMEYRATLLRVAIRVYQVRHDGKLPELLDDLVEDQIIDELPIDPFSGHSFVYRSLSPWNADAMVQVDDATPGGTAWVPIRGQDQILWSPGPALVAIWRSATPTLENRFSQTFGRSEDGDSRDWMYQFLGKVSEPNLTLDEDRALMLGTMWEIEGPARYPKLKLTYLTY